MKKTVCSLLVLSFITPFLYAQAAVPEFINYQGRLVNGTNLVNGVVGLQLRLYNEKLGGSALFEDSNSVTVVDGLYSTVIGDGINTNLPGGQSFTDVLTNAAVYIEVVVNGTVLAPREHILSVAYAQVAGNGGISPPIDITYSNFPDAVMNIRNNGGGPAIWAEATNASGLAAINWGDGNALFAANAGSGPSAIFLGGNVGVGTQTPDERFTANGYIYSKLGGFRFPDGTIQDTAALGLTVNESGDTTFLNGNVGIGTETPSNTLHMSAPYPDALAVQFDAPRFAFAQQPVLTNTSGSIGASSVDYFGSIWTNLNNLSVSDGARASAYSSVGLDLADLYITNFNFSVPTNAFIVGLAFDIESFFKQAPICPGKEVAVSALVIKDGLPVYSFNVYYMTKTNSIKTLSNLVLNNAFNGQNITNMKFLLSFHVSGPDCQSAQVLTAYIDRVSARVSYVLPTTNGSIQSVSYVMGVPAGEQAFVIAPGASLAMPTSSTNDGGFVMTTNGWVGIGTTNPLALFHVDGNAAKPGGGSWQTASDIRLKENIQPLSDTLEKLLSLHGFTFTYKDPAAIHELPGERIGLMAQEVEKVFPDWVEVGPDGYRRLTVRGFEALAVEALRDLKNEKDESVKTLTEQNAALKNELDDLKQRLDAIEKK